MQITFDFIKQATQDDETPEFPEGEYPVILADPAWRYDFSISESRKIENHYPTMELDTIKALEIPAADDCVLFLWTTSPKLLESLEVLEVWGFTYRSSIIWVKTGAKGCGYWVRSAAEFLLIASKGDIKPPKPSNRQDNVIHAKRGAHSQKPVEVYSMIEKMYPDLPKIELFARNERNGWQSWGLEV